jgi:hypothetical protein
MRPSLLAFAALGLVLGGVIWAELEWDPARETAAPGAAIRPPPPTPGPAAAADAGRRAALAETVLARPLFTPGRRPPTPGQVAVGPAPAANKGLPRMTGILIDGESRRAIFVGPEGGRPVVVAEGGRVGGFVVQKIDPQSVTVSGPDGTRTVRAAFDPHPPPPVQAAAVPGLAGLAGGPPPMPMPPVAR